MEDWSELTATQAQINKEIMKREAERAKYEYESQKMKQMIQDYQNMLAAQQNNTHTHSGFAQEYPSWTGYERPVNYDVTLYDLLRKSYGI